MPRPGGRRGDRRGVSGKIVSGLVDGIMPIISMLTGGSTSPAGSMSSTRRRSAPTARNRRRSRDQVRRLHPPITTFLIVAFVIFRGQGSTTACKPARGSAGYAGRRAVAARDPRFAEEVGATGLSSPCTGAGLLGLRAFPRSWPREIASMRRTAFAFALALTIALPLQAQQPTRMPDAATRGCAKALE